MRDEFVCAYDEDDNGLDDAIEKQLAQALVPRFRFDAAEEHTGSGEPRAVFSTRVSLNDLGERIITVRYVFVWHEDGGFVNDADLWCGNAHAGDAQPMTATVRLIEGQDRWFAQLEKLAGFTGGVDAFEASLLDYEEAHPLVYPSAGKHHFYPYKNEYWYDVEGGTGCTDNAWGNGMTRTPVVEQIPHGTWSNNVPPSYALANACNVPSVCVDDPVGFLQAYPMVTCDYGDGPELVELHATYCTDYPKWVMGDDGRRHWINVCTERRTEAHEPALNFLRPLDLIDWGYGLHSGPSILSKFFRARKVSGIYPDFENTAEDVDGDGFARWDDACPMVAFAWSGVDGACIPKRVRGGGQRGISAGDAQRLAREAGLPRMARVASAWVPGHGQGWLPRRGGCMPVRCRGAARPERVGRVSELGPAAVRGRGAP
jgi:hypothetical protein